MYDESSCSGGCEGCDANCGFNGSATLTLNLDDGTTQECAVVAIFPSASRKQYIALLPLDENGQNITNEVYLFRYFENNGQPSLSNIEDTQEYQEASEGFGCWMEELNLESTVETVS